MNQQRSHVSYSGSHALRAAHQDRLLIRITAEGNMKIPLEQGITTIGRRASNDVCIESRFISRVHARIISTAAGAIIEDLNSCNGIAVNAQQVRRHKLRSGDMIVLGRIQLRYIDLNDATRADGHA
jgi:general secretion pathway protein A